MKRLLGRHEFYLFLIILLFSLVITLINPNFLTLENFFDLAKGYSFLGVLAVGVLVVLISGGIDISFTAVTTVAEYMLALYLKRYTGNIVAAFLLAVCIGAALGAINALLIYFLRIPTIITTIATLNIYYGLLTVLSGGTWIYALPEWFVKFSGFKLIRLATREGIPYGLSVVTAIWIGVIILAFIILRRTTLGRSIYSIGGNIVSARRVGINIFNVQLFVYCFMGLLCGVAAVIHALLVQTVAPNAIVGKELDVIAAVVLGGASIGGGHGTLGGTFLGVALMALMSNGLTFMHVSSFWYNVVVGLIILVSISISAYRLRAREKQKTVADVGP